MIDIHQISPDTIRFDVDLSIYSDTVISKVLYRFANDYIIHRERTTDNRQTITLKNKNGIICPNGVEFIQEKLSCDFTDFKTREIIYNETKDIRTILYVKAFANNDDFEDYNLIDEQ